MTICVINNLFTPYTRGGAEEVVRVIVDTLRRQGHTVHVLTLRPRGRGWKAEAMPDDVTVWRLAPWNLFSFFNIGDQPAWKRLLWHGWDMVNPHTAYHVWRWLRAHQPDLVLTHNLKGLGYSIPRVIARSGCRHIHTLHDVQLLTPTGLQIYGQTLPWWQRMAVSVYATINRWLWGSPAGVVSPSQWLYQEHRSLGFFSESAVKIIPNPAPLAVGLSRQSTPTVVTLLYVGQIEPHKGIIWLIEQLRLVKHDFQLKVIGKGSAMAEAQAAAANDSRISFLGFIPHAELTTHYSQAHFTVVPSLCYENSPTVIYESFAAGTPVLGAALGGIPELVHDRTTGYLFTPGDSHDFQLAFENALKNLHAWPQLSQNAQATVAAWAPSQYLMRLWLEEEDQVSDNSTE